MTVSLVHVDPQVNEETTAAKVVSDRLGNGAPKDVR